MANIEEIPPIMVLEKESGDLLVFRFRGRIWGLATLMGGLILILLAGTLQFHRHLGLMRTAPIWVFGVLLLYSALYSFMADQFLSVDGRSRRLHFHKHNLYGTVDWERSGDQFKEIKVFRPSSTSGIRAKNWNIVLAGSEGPDLSLGENEFGSLSRERAMVLAAKVSGLTGIQVTEDPT